MTSNQIQLRRTAGSRVRPALYGLLAAMAALPFLLPTASAAPAGPSATSALAGMPAESAPASQPPIRYSKAALIPIDDEINDVMLESLKRRIAEAQKDGADLLVFEMDTPGGMVTSALKICDTIKGVPQHTVAWINTKAYSAGAIIAMACNEIIMARRSTIGDAMPIMIGAEGVRAVAEDVKPKINSPLLEELRDSARRNGYSMLLCESMIRPGIQVFWVQNNQTGEKRFVDWSEKDELFGIAQPGAASQPINIASKTEWTFVTSTPTIPHVRQPVVGSNELLTMSQNEAIAFGFAAPTMVSSVTELANLYGLAMPPERLEVNWSEQLVAWLTAPIIRSGLLIIALLAGYIELNHPGVLLPGLVALAFLALFLSGHPT